MKNRVRIRSLWATRGRGKGNPSPLESQCMGKAVHADGLEDKEEEGWRREGADLME